MTHAFLLIGEDPTLCMFCKIPLSVKHILLDCPGLNTSRMLFYQVTSLKDIFNDIMSEKVLDFFFVNYRCHSTLFATLICLPFNNE